MKLSKCNLGVVVVQAGTEKECYPNIGHIVGLCKQHPSERAGDRGETIVEVLWAGDNRPTKIHPTNIELYKD